MKWFRFCTAVAVLSLTAGAQVQAGVLDLLGSGKSCGCAEDCQPSCCKPVCCKPTITRPCDVSVHTYQRKCSDIKPPCCDDCCAPKSCCAPANACAPKCTAPAACAPKCDNGACAPKCAAPAACCNKGAGCDADGCCGEDCCPCVDPCEIAKLIYASQTCCYAKDRAEAIEDLGNDYTCRCNPEIMTAFIYALNDADERVRKEAADEIGDQLRKNPCCCSDEIVAALTCALGDCDKGVRRQAEEALCACGYEVVDGCCDTCCDSGCDKCGGAAPAPATKGKAPAPAPPAASYPSRGRRPNRLADLFGLLD